MRKTLATIGTALILCTVGIGHADARPHVVTRWGADIDRELARQHVGNRHFWHDELLRICQGESSGNPLCRTGSHVGLFQFSSSWHLSRILRRDNHHGDWRLCPYCSIARIVRVVKVSPRTVRSAWAATY
jgi:hypothetical protein